MKMVRVLFMRKLGAMCAAHRRKLPCKQSDVAREMGVSQTTVSKFERGQNDSVRLLSWYVVRGLKLPPNVWTEIAGMEADEK